MSQVFKKSVISMIFILFCLNYSIAIVNAEQLDNLKDCLEQDEDCLQREEVPAEENNNEDAPLLENDGLGSSFLLNVFKMIFALILILGLIFFIAKLWNRKSNQLQQSNILENIGGIPLGQNKSMQIVRIGNRCYVMGIGENVQLLMEITDDKVIEQFLQYEENSEDFKTIFQSIFQKTKDNNKKGSKKDSFMSTLSDELEQMKQHRHSIIDDKVKKDDQHE